MSLHAQRSTLSVKEHETVCAPKSIRSGVADHHQCGGQLFEELRSGLLDLGAPATCLLENFFFPREAIAGILAANALFQFAGHRRRQHSAESLKKTLHKAISFSEPVRDPKRRSQGQVIQRK